MPHNLVRWAATAVLHCARLWDVSLTGLSSALSYPFSKATYYLNQFGICLLSSPLMALTRLQWAHWQHTHKMSSVSVFLLLDSFPSTEWKHWEMAHQGNAKSTDSLYFTKFSMSALSKYPMFAFYCFKISGHEISRCHYSSLPQC